MVFGLNSERGDYSLIRLAEKIDTKIEIERVLFDHTRVNRSRKIVEFNLRWTTQIRKQLKT